MAEIENGSYSVSEEMRKKIENETKPSQHNDDDTESNEEQPLDLGDQYMVKRSDENWRKIAILTSLFFVYILNIFLYRSSRDNTDKI